MLTIFCVLYYNKTCNRMPVFSICMIFCMSINVKKKHVFPSCIGSRMMKVTKWYIFIYMYFKFICPYLRWAFRFASVHLFVQMLCCFLGGRFRTLCGLLFFISLSMYESKKLLFFFYINCVTKTDWFP